MEFQLFDKSTRAGSNRTVTAQGYLAINDCILARSGVFEYYAGEFQPRAFADKRPDEIVRVYRSPATIAKAVAGFSGAPVTDEHPPVLLDALNTRKYQEGHINGDVVAEPDPDHPGETRMRAALVITGDTLIKAVNSKAKEELSNGYVSAMDMTPGVSPQGEQFDCEQLDIRPNHVAVVEAGRNGPTCRLSDALDINNPEKTQMSTVTINGVTYEASEQVVQAVNQLQAELAACKGEANTAAETISGMEAAAAETAAAVTDLEAKLAEEQAKTTPEAMDEAVEERQEVLDAARRLVPNFDGKGKTNDAIRREVLKAKGVEVATLDSKSHDYIVARFEALAAKDSKASELDKGLGEMVVSDSRSARHGQTVPNSMEARDAAIKRHSERWKK